MTFSKEQWAKMKWAIHDLPKNKDVLNAYPDLNNIFSGITDWVGKYSLTEFDEFVRYLILVYHQKSPFAQNISDTIKRKVEVLVYLGIKPDAKGKFSDNIDRLIYVRDESVAYITIQFIKYENDRMWAKYCVNCELYWRAMFLTMKEGESDKKGADEVLKVQLENKKKLSDVEREMEAQESVIFSDDKDVANYVPSYLEEEKKLKIFPEDFVLTKQEE